jgi:hypothetical protein
MSEPLKVCHWTKLGIIGDGAGFRWRSECGQKSDCSANWSPQLDRKCWYCGKLIVVEPTRAAPAEGGPKEGET